MRTNFLRQLRYIHYIAFNGLMIQLNIRVVFISTISRKTDLNPSVVYRVVVSVHWMFLLEKKKAVKKTSSKNKKQG